MSTGRLDIVNAVRRVLVKSWLDVSKVRIQVTGGSVLIRGVLKSSHDDEPLTGSVIEDVEQKIRTNVKEAGRVRWHLENWAYDRGKWKEKESR